MQFIPPLIEGRLLKRYKRFLADIELPDGSVVTAHTANTGAMTGCCAPGSRVWLSRSDNPKRKYPLTWEIVEISPGVSCGINTMLSNKLIREAIESGYIKELSGYQNVRSEVRYGNENSRIDLLLESDAPENRPPCYVEVKNVTLMDNGVGLFPDAVTARGTKHLRELMCMVEQGYRAVIFYCVQRNDCSEVRPADAIDALYGKTLRQALTAGVEGLAYSFRVSPEGINPIARLPVSCKTIGEKKRGQAGL
jgi:sugar fermentation stimulation protein A